MKIKDMPWFNRPNAKIKKYGVSNLDDAELLSIIFGRGNKKGNAIELANSVLSKYNWQSISNQSVQELTNILGDKIRAYQVLCIGEICKRFSKLKNKGFIKSIRSSKDVFNIMKYIITDNKKEHLFAIYLNSQNFLIDKPELITMGLLDKSLVHPREVFKNAIKKSAKNIIIVHNHPSGNVSPSKADKQVTKTLKKSGKIIGINLLDHLIISKEKYFSFKDNNQL